MTLTTPDRLPDQRTADRDLQDAVARRAWTHDAARPRLEKRAGSDDPADRVIVGYAAVFYRADQPGTEFRLWTDAYERILPGAFDTALKEDLVRGTWNHDETQLLGRSDRGTLRLSVDATGLRYEIDPPDTQAARDLLTLLNRGDVDGSSFTFRVYGGKRGAVAWLDEIRDGRSIEVREVRDLELVDVGPVTFPAYAAASAAVRGDWRESYLLEARADWERHRAERALDLRTASTAGDEAHRELDLRIAADLAAAELAEA